MTHLSPATAWATSSHPGHRDINGTKKMYTPNGIIQLGVFTAQIELVQEGILAQKLVFFKNQ